MEQTTRKKTWLCTFPEIEARSKSAQLSLAEEILFHSRACDVKMSIQSR